MHDSVFIDICTRKVELGDVKINPFVKNIKYECLNKLIFLSERQVRYAAQSFVAHYNKARPHLGLGGKMIEPYKQPPNGKIVKFESLGGLLKSYRRVDETFKSAA